MTFADYVKLDRENFSRLKHILTSPLHYKTACKTEVEETIDMRLGTAVHEWVLEGRVSPFVVRPECNEADASDLWHGNKKWCKAWLAAQTLPVYAPDDNERRMRMQNALAGSELFQELMAACPEREKTVQADYMHLPMKARLDAAGYWEVEGKRRRLIMDLKKTPDASPRAWGKKACNFHYDMQIFLYANLLALAEDLSEPPMVVHAVVEDSDAAPVCLYRVSDEMWASGQAKLARAVTTLLTCREADYWPGYGEEGLITPIWPKSAQFDQAA